MYLKYLNFKINDVLFLSIENIDYNVREDNKIK